MSVSSSSLFRHQTLSADQEQRLAAEELETATRRLRRILPLMVLVNLVHVAITSPWSPFRQPEYPEVLHRWADGILAAHLSTAIVAACLTTFLFASKHPPRWVGPVGALVYLLHAAMVAGADQLNGGTVVPYVGYAIVNAVAVLMTVREALAIYAIGAFAFVVAVSWVQPDTPTRLTVLPTGLSIAVPAVCIVWFLNHARRANFFLRDTVASQRAALETVNDRLQEQVQEQVVALVSRAAEVEQLNDLLRERVNDRSRELAVALRKLAQRGDGDAIELDGVLLSGRFRLKALIGSGGMGVVHRAIDETTGMTVAVKLMQDRTTLSPSALARFLREVESASSVRHPAIVRMLHVDITDDGRLFQVQELVQGRSLASWLTRVHQFDAEPALAILSRLADALAAAHEKGIVHRDVKPDNIMLVPEEPGVKLLDFGVAKVGGTHEDDGNTATGALVGTPAYMAPEMWSGAGEATAAADVYAVGVCAARMLTGRLPNPFGSESVDPFAELDGPSGDLLRNCLAHSPGDRPTAKAIREALPDGCLPDLATRISEGALGPWLDRTASAHTHLSFH